ncbi:hypothetical protein [Butyrivibrio sp. VCD2006]|uniref:hypothetical protein n=1 Tax=Butyrivibrio sp. VCD2006 TaxID=1280664 RepID=UPI0018CA33F4|nr:hypothetical protein [Butyrivibrio sp. VCD2006]
MNILDTTGNILTLYESGHFNTEKWKAYMDTFIPGAKELCLADMQDCLRAGFTWEKDYLPVLNAVIKSEDKLEMAISSFYEVTSHLEDNIITRFGKSVEADIYLYLGLCNGAGWVTTIGGKTTVLLGIEKILELNWCGVDDMNGLIIHELGHVYHSQYGNGTKKAEILPDRFLWQLFREGVAMVFEQEVLGDPEYFHQDKNGWKKWCDSHIDLIKESFSGDLKTMTHENQRYFGDWVNFEGHIDTGYYLGTEFVRFLLKSDSFENIIMYDIDKVKSCIGAFR